MNISLNHALAALIAVPCIVAMAKATDNGDRIIAALCLLTAVGAVVAPVLIGTGVRIDVGRIGWVACGLISIITGGVLGALLELGVITRS